jgi:hypothetical protein
MKVAPNNLLYLLAKIRIRFLFSYRAEPINPTRPTWPGPRGRPLSLTLALGSPVRHIPNRGARALLPQRTRAQSESGQAHHNKLHPDRLLHAQTARPAIVPPPPLAMPSVCRAIPADKELPDKRAQTSAPFLIARPLRLLPWLLLTQTSLLPSASSGHQEFPTCPPPPPLTR